MKRVCRARESSRTSCPRGGSELAAWTGPDLAWAGACRSAWIAPGPRALGHAWVYACVTPGCAPETSAGLLTGREKGKRGGRKKRKKEKKERRKERSGREKGEREEKENFECARVFRRSKPDYIAFGFFVKHEKLPI